MWIIKINHYYTVYNYDLIMSISSTGVYGSATLVNSRGGYM
jgi:hypothetical protein